MLKISNYQIFYVFKFIFLLLVLVHCQPGLEKYPTDYAFLLLKEKSYNVSLKIINLEGSDLSIQLNYQTPNEIEKTEELLPLKKETEIHSKFSYPSRTKISLKINKQPLNPNQVCTFNKSNVEIFESNVGDIEVNCFSVLAPPTFSILPGTYASSQMLTISPPSIPAGATVSYRNDGNDPACTDPSPPTPINVSVNQQIRAITCLPNWIPSPVAGGTYSIGSSLRIWVTNSTTMGNLNGTGGTVGGDSMCNNMADTNHPGSGTYKALIWTGTRTHLSADWPLNSLTNYYRTDGTTLIGATDNQKIFTATLNNPIHGTNFKVWTGIRANSNPWNLGADHCSNFTLNLITLDGVFGSSNQTAPGDAFGRNGGPNRSSCDQLLRLYCVEQ